MIFNLLRHPLCFRRLIGCVVKPRRFTSVISAWDKVTFAHHACGYRSMQATTGEKGDVASNQVLYSSQVLMILLLFKKGIYYYTIQQFHTLIYTSKRLKCRESNKCLYTQDHSNIIHRSQKVEVIHPSINRAMDKENVFYIDNGTLLNLKKEGAFWHRLQHGWTLRTLYQMK